MSTPTECENARRHLMLAESGTSELSGAEAHVGACAACSAHLDVEHAMLQVVASLRQVETPTSLRNALRARLDREDVIGASPVAVPLHRRRSFRRLVALAAAAVLALMLVPDSTDDATDRASPFAVTTILEDQSETLETSSFTEAGRWLVQRVDYSINVPDLPGTNLVGTGVTTFEGHRTATVSYRVDGRELTYLIVPTTSAFAHSVAAGRGPYYLEDGSDKVVVWGNGNSARVLLGAIPARDLLRLAEHCRRHELGLL